MKVLHAYLQPKNIPEVLEPLKEIPCDKLYIKYYGYPYPHRIARDFFLAHEEYTHLAIHANDLVVTKQDYQKMLDNFEKYPFLEIISGVCNVDTESEKDYWNVCDMLPTLEENTRRYKWNKKNSFTGLQRKRFAGFPYMWIERKIMQKINANSERPLFDGTDLFGKDGYAADLWFCHGLYHNGIPIYCDGNIDMLHLRFFGEMLVGKEKPSTIWVHDGIEEQIHEFDMDVFPLRKKITQEEYKKQVDMIQKEILASRLDKYHVTEK